MDTLDEQSVSRAQALLLYAIVLHARQQFKEADQCIRRAAKIALALGMNLPSFAKEHAAADPLVEESFRRTWWELYTVDLYTAALHRRPTCETKTATLLPLLPCSQATFDMGQCDADPPTLRAFEERPFALSPRIDFSSYCYRIEAIRIVDRVMSLTASDDASPDSVQAVDNAIASWRYNLPPNQSDVINLSGEVDEMLFQAHVYMHCASIFLHFPRSDLPATVSSAVDMTCARVHKSLSPTSTQHTIKAIAASKQLSNLAAIPWELDLHTPFFICGLILGCIVQLAAASLHRQQRGYVCLDQHRDRVLLLIGALKFLGQKWTVAESALHCLRVIADSIFTTRADLQTEFTVQNDRFVTGEDFSNMSWFDLFTPEEVQRSQLYG